MDKSVKFENGAAEVNLLQISQTGEFGGRMAAMAARADRATRRRLVKNGYMLETGIFSGEKLAAAYRGILIKEAKCPAAVRQDIERVGNAALKQYVDEAAAQLQEESAGNTPEKAEKKPAKRSKSSRSTTAKVKKEAAS